MKFTERVKSETHNNRLQFGVIYVEIEELNQFSVSSILYGTQHLWMELTTMFIPTTRENVLVITTEGVCEHSLTLSARNKSFWEMRQDNTANPSIC